MIVTHVLNRLLGWDQGPVVCPGHGLSPCCSLHSSAGTHTHAPDCSGPYLRLPCDSQRREWGCPLAETMTSSLGTQATQFSSSIKWKQCPFSMGNGVRFGVRQRGTDYSVLHTCMSLGTQVHPQQCP